ncbi:acyltransferase [Sphingomonas sp. Leaf34]|uniref:acyltransferase n=1 Tax=Sphingomonas sp. Leaf34 TaxID=1736216 RepID=UPI0009E7B7A3|nr:acyltransferase [Sphingomonas sp. Leaf34]
MELVGFEAARNLPGLRVSESAWDQMSLHLGPKAIASLERKTASLILDARSVIAGTQIEVGDFAGTIRLTMNRPNIRVKIGECRKLNLSCMIYGHATLQIGDKTSINEATGVIVNGGISIGSDCMLSHNVHLQACDQHGIIDVESRTITNTKRTITIGEHVWVARGVTVCPGTVIGKGSIIGAASVVTKEVPPFTVAAGNPATVLKTGVSWTRQLDEIDAEATAFLNGCSPSD